MTESRQKPVSLAQLMVLVAAAAVALGIISPALKDSPGWHWVLVMTTLFLPCWCAGDFWPWGERWSERTKLLVTVALVLGIVAVLAVPLVVVFSASRGID